jgi:23S rRNA U2552 (ribose-2'-O)-methylase RlmE/FtsJ
MKTKILVVDDETDLELLIRQKFRRQIREGVYEFVFAVNGREALAQLAEHPDTDVVLSDMAPKTTGVRLQDQLRSLELCELALGVAEKYLKPGGSFVAKLFHSQEYENFRKQLRERFAKVESLRPESTRKESKEIFLVGMQYKPKEATQT